ncbi:MAG TPA: tetratricopeptide repeat protein [Bacteroidia bacterium]|nr:tetratricopeptide repeat protein [Bacteroidia bacterium]
MKKRISLSLIFLVFCHITIILAQQEPRIIDSLKQKLIHADDTSKIIILNELALEYRHFQPQYLLEYTLQAKKLSEQMNYKKGIAFALFNMGQYYSNQGDHQKAISYFDQSMILIKKFNFPDLKNKVFLAYGSSVRDLNGDYKTAKAYFDTVLRTASLEKNNKVLVDVLSRIANIYSAQCLYDSSAAYNIRSLEIAEKIKDSIMMGRLMVNMGLEEYRHGNNEKAMEYYLSGLDIATKIKNKMVAAYSLLNIACFQMDKKENTKAVDNLLKSLELATELDYKTLVISLNIHLGYAYYGMGNYDKAFNYYQLGYELAKKNKELLQVIRILNGMGKVMKDKKKYTKAISYLEQALEENKNADYKEELSDTYLTLSQAYAGETDFKKAYQYHILHKTTDSIIFNKEKEVARDEITTKYNSEKKTKEILVLKKDNEIKDLQLSNNRLIIIAAIIIILLTIIIFFIFYNKFQIKRKANEEKDILLREIHHRVKNNMQIILSILNLQARKTNDQKIIDFIRESESRIQSMAIMHEKLYQSDSLASIPFKEYISQLIEFIYKIYNVDKNQIDYLITSSDIHLDINTAVPLGLIINEVVCNSLKHGFGHAEIGKIDIKLTSLPANEYELIILDNGKGLPENFDIKTTKTLGLKLIQTLIKQIGGKLEIGYGKGTVFNIHFKEAA